MNTGYLVQGLKSNTLVAGKTSALRINKAAGFSMDDINGITALIARPDGSVINMNWAANQLVKVDAGTSTEGIVVLIPGNKIPDIGFYYIMARLISNAGAVLGTCTIDAARLLPTKDLRMMVNRIWSNTGPAAKPGEVEAAIEAMKRLAAIYPIRDGISTLNGNTSAGLRYNFDNDVEGPPSQDANLGPAWDAFQNPPAGKDTLDVAIAYRFPDAGEGSGAITHAKYKGWLPNSGIVWQGPVAQVFSHETGHNHGLESPQSPHFDPTGQAAHSKDLTIEESDAQLGFDIEFNQPFPKPLFDVMFPTGPAPGYNPPQVSMNGWDWEFLRTQIMKSNSTGPHEPFISWQSLGGHNLQSGPSAIRNRHGALEVFVLGADKRLYHIAESIPGGAWTAWNGLDGHDLKGPVTTILNGDGQIQVFVAGSDGKIYSRTQQLEKNSWAAWTTAGGTNIKGYAIARNKNSTLDIIAVFADGILYHSSQLPQNAGWSAWTSLEGHDLAGPVSLAMNQQGRLVALAVGGNSAVYYRLQNSSENKDGWGAWARLTDIRFVKAVDVKTAVTADSKITVVVMTANKSISCVSESATPGVWGPVVDFFGHDLVFPCCVAGTDQGRLEIAVTGGDKKLYSRWQPDPVRPSLWANWTPLGGRDLTAGPGMAANREGQMEIFIVGGDGALYRGPRSGS